MHRLMKFRFAAVAASNLGEDGLKLFVNTIHQNTPLLPFV
jgi:hypothetical protein